MLKGALRATYMNQHNYASDVFEGCPTGRMFDDIVHIHASSCCALHLYATADSIWKGKCVRKLHI